jgi:hypothetical protein
MRKLKMIIYEAPLLLFHKKCETELLKLKIFNRWFIKIKLKLVKWAILTRFSDERMCVQTNYYCKTECVLQYSTVFMHDALSVIDQ